MKERWQQIDDILLNVFLSFNFCIFGKVNLSCKIFDSPNDNLQYDAVSDEKVLRMSIICCCCNALKHYSKSRQRVPIDNFNTDTI